MRAKINIAKTMEKGDVELSKWYLERKARDEFGNNQKIEHSGVDGEPLTLEIKL